MVKRYSKRAYRKKTQRKSRSNRRRMTQKRGGLGFNIKEFASNTPFNSIYEFSNMSFNDKLITVLGKSMEVFMSFSKMVFSLMVYVYIAKIFITNPGAAKQMFIEKTNEIKEQHPKLFNCMNAVFTSVKADPDARIDIPSKSLLDKLKDNGTDFMLSKNKLEFIKNLITEPIDKLKVDIQQIKENPELKACFDEAMMNVEAKKTEVMDKLATQFPISSRMFGNTSAPASASAPTAAPTPTPIVSQPPPPTPPPTPSPASVPPPASVPAVSQRANEKPALADGIERFRSRWGNYLGM